MEGNKLLLMYYMKSRFLKTEMHVDVIETLKKRQLYTDR